MTVTETPRLKLLSETDDELVDQFTENWTNLDTKSGIKSVADNATPPVGETYDGQIIAESTSGKIWIARWNPGTASYDKKWLVYPWSIECQVNSFSQAAGSANKPFDQIRAGGANVNSSASDLVGGKIVAPVDGIYAVDSAVNFNVSSGANYCHTSIVVADDSSTDSLSRSQDFSIFITGTNTNLTACRIVKLLKGQTVYLRMGHQHSAAVTTTASCTMSLVSPL